MAVVAASRAALGAIIDVLTERGHQVVGPVVRHGSLALDRVTTEQQLPVGVTIDQAPGRSRLAAGHGPARFAWAPTPSWRPILHPPQVDLLQIRSRASGAPAAAPTVEPTAPAGEPLALLGARDCDLRAIGILDQVLGVGGGPDPDWVERRRDLFVVAVTCGEPASTCWCTITGGSPVPERFDLRLTELTPSDPEPAGTAMTGTATTGTALTGTVMTGTGTTGAAAEPDPDTLLLIESGSPAGEAVLAEVAARLDGAPADDEHHALAERIIAEARAVLEARSPRPDLPELRRRADEVDRHRHWDEVAARCVACGNCTSVCPTCFCVSLVDDTGLPTGDDPGGTTVGVRRRTWASCFELDHSLLGGHAIRATRAARYRQWLAHKLVTWQAQFGTPGCVGCGRCSIACPVGIDLPTEAAALSVGAP